MNLLAALIPQAIKDKVAGFVDFLQGLLQGETVLVIGNGAAVVIYLVAKAVKVIPDQTFEQAAGLATAAIVVLNAALVSIRHFVSSPATAANLQEQLAYMTANWSSEVEFHHSNPVFTSPPAQDVVIDGDPVVSPDLGAE